MVKYLSITIIALLIFSGCSVGKFIPDDQMLVTKQSVQIKSENATPYASKLANTLSLQLKPKTSYGIGKFNLWLYYKTQTEKDRGLKSWLNRKFAKPPIYLDNQLIQRHESLIKTKLIEEGYFDHVLALDTIVDVNKIDIRFDIETPGRYVIRDIYYPADTVPLNHLFQEAKKSKPISKGQYYEKVKIDSERNRLFNNVVNEGYLDFEKSSILFYLDTIRTERKTDVYIEIQNISDSSALTQYRIGETYVFPDYDLDTPDTLLQQKDTLVLPKLNIVQSTTVVKPKTLSRIIDQPKGAIANTQSNNLTLSKFQNLGIFKFTNVNTKKRVQGDSAYIDRFFYLTPSLNQQIVGEFEVNNRTGDFFGSAFSFSYLHRNLFKGGELFEATASTGIETQLGQVNSFTNTLDISGDLSLTIPHFVLPFRFSVNHIGNARTTIKVGNSFQVRKDFFTLTAFNTSWSYEWKSNFKTSLSATPLRFNLVNLINTTDEFEAILDSSPRLRSNFQNSLILGADFSVVYNNQTTNSNDPYILALSKFSTSGNLLSLFNKSLPLNEAGQREFLGTSYAQFIKIVPEIRYYHPRKNGLWAARLGLGIGLPYGNSEALPYIEQFFVGGSNSIRAFRIRQLGPGSFIPEDIDQQVGFFDQTGDIKFEANIEYRFDIFGFLKGAVFTDAANVWTLNKDLSNEGVFKFDQFYKEIAIGTGLGLRLDFNFFVIRLDGAFALRKPTTSGFEWTISEIAPFDKVWRSENLVWNLALGYPF